MESNALSPELSPELEFVYSNESAIQQMFWPLIFSQTVVPSVANDLNTDTSGTFFTYSGDWQSLLISKQKEGRYKNFTIKAYSGDSFKFYFTTNAPTVGAAKYYAGPLTISGSYARFTTYSGETDARNNPITFSSPADNSRIFTLPEINNIHWMRLYHKSFSGSTPYRVYQFLPRTLIQVDDLEAEVIDAVTLRVSDSIVIGPNLIGDKTILGQKIADGTVSGILMTNGTITANKLTITQLDAVAANMGNLVVNSGISIGTQGYLWAGAGSANAPTTGLKVYTSNGISRLTTFSGGIAQVDIGSDGKLYTGSGQSLKLDSTGMTLKTAVSGVSVSIFSRVPASISTVAYPPKENVIKFHPYNFQVTSGTPTFYEDPSDTVLAFFENTELYSTHSSAYNQDRWLGSKTRIRSGWLASESGLNSMYKKTDDSYMYFESFGQHNTALKLATGKDGSQASITLSGSSLNYTQINFDAKSLWFTPEQAFTVNNPESTVTFAGPTTVNNTLTAGATTISGTLNVASNFNVNTNKFTVAPATGNTVVAGTLSVTGAASASNLSGTNRGDQILPVYGDGADGYVNFDLSSSNSSFATFNGSSTYTLTRDVFATIINVVSSAIVITAGYRLFAQNEISNYGTIHNNGSSGAGSTAGAGGLGGFFKAGGAGAVGLLAASAGAAGNAQATPTANTWVGGIGGRGGQGRLNNIGFNGGQITSANVTTPANADGGSKVTSNYVNYLTRYVVGATNWQMTPSIGGGGGAKSVTGTAATSGAGGGGGGICFVAAPIITGNGAISANGGSGGNAAGTGGSFGGGGGGGGGVVCVIAKTSAITPTATGGTGGTSIFGTNGTQPVAHAFGTNTTATQTLTLTPAHPLSKGKLYLITVHLNVAAGLGGSGINSITGYGINWTNLTGSRVEYSTIAAPTRAQETWYGSYTGTEPDLIESGDIVINLSNINTAARVIIDEISGVELSTAVTSNIATNATNSAMTLTVTLPNVPVAGNMVYSVFTRSAGAATAAGAGNVLVNSQVTAPQISSQVSSAQQANTQTHTTNFATMGAFSVELTASIAGASGSDGWAGKVIRIYG